MTKSDKIFQNLPRIIAVVFISFISLFALDVFGAGYGFWMTIVALFIHLIPSFILIALLAVAWRWSGFGGLMHIFLGLAYAIIVWFRLHSFVFFVVAAPLFVIGFLFILDQFKNIKIEMLELLDEDGRPTGKLASRRTVHQKGLWHAVTRVWLFDSRDQILLQKRSANKESWPGLWDISASGHIRAGETSEQAARRELFEELGIKAGNLKKIGVIKVSKSMLEKKYFENEFCDIYVAELNANTSTFKLNDKEVAPSLATPLFATPLFAKGGAKGGARSGVAEVKLISFDEFEKQVKDPEQRKKFVPHWGYYLEMLGKIRRERGEEI